MALFPVSVKSEKLALELLIAQLSPGLFRLNILTVFIALTDLVHEGFLVRASCKHRASPMSFPLAR